MIDSYLNSVNLNSNQIFPYLCMDVQKGKSVPEPPGFHVMHWHEDFQFIYVYTGKLFLHTLDQTRIINENSGVFINKNIVHLVLASEDCHYKSFLFPKQLVSFYTGGPALRYVDIVSECEQISCLLLEKSVSWQKDILDLLVKLSGLESQRTEFYEYEILVFLSQLWLILIKNIKTPHTIVTDDVKKRMQLFLKYIELHYAEELSLDELARCAGVSKSECLRCFKFSMQTTPYQYLTEYRLLKASELLVNTELSMGEISNSVGFNSQSHFGKMFKLKTKLTPLNYRKVHTKNSNMLKNS
jgi:AraC-like DNA-binding protein